MSFTISLPNGTTKTLTKEEYLSMMKEYGAKRSRTVRTSRKYLRSLGIVLDRNGKAKEIIVSNEQ